MAVFKDLFRSKSRYATVKPAQTEGEAAGAKAAPASPAAPPARPKEVPDGLWTKCPGCQSILYQGELARHLQVCERCGYHFHVGAAERLRQLLDDPEAFEEWETDLVTVNPLGFPGYEEKLARMQAKTGLTEAVVTGAGQLDGHPLAIGVLDFSFFSGSMGSVVGEKLTRLFERAAERRLPVVIVSGGGGGARMQEGILSLMQMAKTSQAVEEFGRSRRPYISVLTNPTMGGVYASFASLGDYILAEPGALIGFAGPRIVERTIRQSLPAGFQTAEFALKHGMVDAIVPRKDLRPTLARILRLHQG
ncbi:MAG TPA: acetyl-CoA carboxylase, carboxyltransferase subunit beta [Limnochordales bacterium]|nr:acetyl-CoA carboxylase, carboxyltransferase subunit beta [Limnochordales bacterium]